MTSPLELHQADPINDVVAIGNVKARYCRAADLLPVDPEAAQAGLEAVFTEDATADYGHGPLVGRAAILDFLIGQLSTTRVWLWHAIHTPLIELRGEQASGCWTIVAMMRESADSPIETAFGRYEDLFRRDEGGWRIAGMRWIEEART